MEEFFTVLKKTKVYKPKCGNIPCIPKDFQNMKRNGSDIVLFA
jgi:hypothetical protein